MFKTCKLSTLIILVDSDLITYHYNDKHNIWHFLVPFNKHYFLLLYYLNQIDFFMLHIFRYVFIYLNSYQTLEPTKPQLKHQGYHNMLARNTKVTIWIWFNNPNPEKEDKKETFILYSAHLKKKERVRNY